MRIRAAFLGLFLFSSAAAGQHIGDPMPPYMENYIVPPPPKPHHCSDHQGDLPTGASVKLVCTRAWPFMTYDGAGCNGQDMVTQWQRFTSNPRFEPGWMIRPWENQRITIIGFEIIAKVDDAHDWYMVGNNYAPDPMMYLAKDEPRGRMFLPSGYGFPFPSANEATAMDYIDLHGICHGPKADLLLNIYYSPEGN